MRSLNHTLKTLPYFAAHTPRGRGPKRKTFTRPPTGFAFVAPLNQSFIRDPRLMPGTTRMVCLLAGWGGNGRPIDTTLGAIGRNIGRSARQVQRYLKDAVEEGYLYFHKIKNRLGYITGLRIVLSRAAIYKHAKPKLSKPPKPRKDQATTQESDINPILFLDKESPDALDRKLVEICDQFGIEYETG